MIQSVHCPSCDTHYGLKPARVRAGIRRARCFRCATVFGIEAEVMLLVAGEASILEAAPAPASGPPNMEQIQAFDEFDAASLEAIEDLPAFVPAQAASAPSASPADAPEAELELPSLEELEAATEAIEPESLPEAKNEYGDVLSVDDLAGAEEEILDKTLVDYEAPPHPEARPTPPVPLPSPIEPSEEITTTQGGYSSAKDAIDKLLGGTPPPAAAYRPPSHRGGSNMDVEATLSALESTLGGVPAPHPASAPLAPTDLPPPAGATMKLSREEVAAAVSALSAPPALPPRPAPAESTVMLKMPVSEPPQPSMDPNLLKVQMGTELFSNLTMEQLVSLVEQGRLAEFHMVARQFSDNWLEAAKVPGLRPVFERVRKTRLPEPPSSPMETAPIKKSLFGGLFGKN